MYAYHIPGVDPREAKRHPAVQRLLHVGLLFVPHIAADGTLAVLKDWPEPGKDLRRPDDYGEAVAIEDGLAFLPPKRDPDPRLLWELVFGERAGVDVALSCGIAATIPEALTGYRQLRLGRSAERLGPPVTEYGRLAHELAAECETGGGIPYESPRLHRLLELALAQRYRVTAEFLDWAGVLALDDVDELLGAIWCGDPKALRPAKDGGPSPSASSASESSP